MADKERESSGAAERGASWSVPANRSQGRRAVGGRLTLTDTTLVFLPHWVDGRLGGRTWECELANIEDVRVSTRDPRKWLAGGLRERLEICLRDGQIEQFVVPNVVESIDRIKRHLAGA